MRYTDLRPFSNETALSRRHLDDLSSTGRQFRKFKMLYFKLKALYLAGNSWKDIFLGVPTPGDDKNLAGPASFEKYWKKFKCNMKMIWKILQGSNIFHFKLLILISNIPRWNISVNKSNYNIEDEEAQCIFGPKCSLGCHFLSKDPMMRPLLNTATFSWSFIWTC